MAAKSCQETYLRFESSFSSESSLRASVLFPAYLDRTYEQRESKLVMVNGSPLFDPLRSDPRFADLLGRIGLPQ